MDLPEYVTIEEVKRVCQELKISDWTEHENSKISSDEARTILSEVNVEDMDVDLDEFRRGLEVELEHGLRFKDANVTNNHPILTGKIVLAHLKESSYYYKLLEVAELEGDLMEAIMDDQVPELKSLYMRLANARMILRQAEIERLD
ncbi:MAG: hypothetical protein OEV45_03810 [Desulfobacteraceae bacterium]|nr:hypothetical protein [Desulfobacteraceae bacterium]